MPLPNQRQLWRVLTAVAGNSDEARTAVDDAFELWGSTGVQALVDAIEDCDELAYRVDCACCHR
jgi:hypothetical protein